MGLLHLARVTRGYPLVTARMANSDQGSQFTSEDFTGRLKSAGVRISMDGRRRVFDNIFVERLWRPVKYEDVYLRDYENVPAAVTGLATYFSSYNQERLHRCKMSVKSAQTTLRFCQSKDWLMGMPQALLAPSLI